nr:hypothetical protein [Tanacetum cinerariifolium]
MVACSRAVVGPITPAGIFLAYHKTYAVHPEHVRVVNENVKPVVDDIMVVDWRSEGGVSSGGVIEPGKVMRASFVKLKKNVMKHDKSKVLEVIRVVKDEFGVFNGVEEMEKTDKDVEKVRREKEKVKEFVQSVVVVDYMVSIATHQSGNL